jgi:hypothetical protein
MMIPAAGLFLMRRQPRFDAWAFLRVMGVMALLLAGHVLVMKDAGIWTTLYKTAARVSALPGLVLLFISFAAFAFLIKKRIASRRLVQSLQILGVPAVVSGFLLWWGPKLDAGLLFFITAIHGIFSLVMAGILIMLLFFPGFNRK